ncbi:2,3-dihydroxybenzoate-AMP ligase [Chromobacterium violaceum]|uniref:2,3-dihydroxybenzoate-AMP ligase n=1 Tax=Chromobacterium violaceum TaxID=536 RepID=A0A3S4IEF3_CHRVL|nr:2,3-dihydroxybenzoate-AMP ligase [Chromobacterium violaceum]
MAAGRAGREAQLKSLKLLQVGGASFAEATARQVPEVLGCKLQQVFGMAEGLVNYTRLDDGDDIVYGCQGRPMSDADEVKVVDEAGHPVPTGTPGMLATRGPYTFRGYYLAPEHNAACSTTRVSITRATWWWPTSAATCAWSAG